ncbi:hypothetical protein CMT20_06545 [Elizabethkingia anophelis]|nr:hypothetical protein [Elizabethkingia anophelis]
MEKNLSYYCVGFTWTGSKPQNKLPEFLNEGMWGSGHVDRYRALVKTIKIGSKIAAKTTFTKKIDGKRISILKIHAVGIVTHNSGDGMWLGVDWESSFEPIEILNKGSYRSTISKINDIELIREIFGDSELVVKEREIPFYLQSKGSTDESLYPCFKLNRDDWDDYGYKTQYKISYHEDSKSGIQIGTAKFFNKNEDIGDLPEAFTKLEYFYCSLGQDNRYYLNLREKLDKRVSDYYLDAVNDLAVNKGMRDEFEHTSGFKNSLMRSSEAQKAFREGGYVFRGEKMKNTFDFEFTTQIGKALTPHSINFDFTEKGDLPFRIKVLIGKNGTGKTHYLARLASTLSGYRVEGEFNTKLMPAFSRVITISYSLFDNFPRPEKTKGFSYYYCGFRGGKGFLTPKQMNNRFIKAMRVLGDSSRLNHFGRYLSNILNEELVSEILDEDFLELRDKSFSLFDVSYYSKFSSGQLIMILVLAELTAYVTENSLILIDEPETHLHPNSISLFINVINKILNRYESFAIIATHSPQIVQEVPAKDIVVVERHGNVSSTRSVGLETFGENLNSITQRIFHTINSDEYYRTFLSNLSRSKSYDSIIKSFEKYSQPLSLNTKMFLQSKYEESDTIN